MVSHLAALRQPKSCYRANKTLGQHFLTNKGIIKKIIEAAKITPDDVILEIGPGLGALTLDLAARAQKVIAVEKDKNLAEALKEKLAKQEIDNAEIIVGDILKLIDSLSCRLKANKAKSYKLISNIPYYLTSHLIRRILELEYKPENIILMIQKEVARRICAVNKKESLLSLSVKFYADPKILFFVSKGSFLPPPKIDSAVIEITPKKSAPPIDPKKFFSVLKAGFASPRKKLISNLTKNLKISAPELQAAFKTLQISELMRAEGLSLDQWIQLTQNIE